MVIESLDNEKIKNYRKLLLRKNREKENKYLIEGEHLVKEAYISGDLLEIIVLDDKYDFDVNKVFVTKEVMKSISELETPYDIIGVCKFSTEKDYKDKILILDAVQDPGNLGTIIRSAVAFNVDTIVLGIGCADVYNSKVLRGCQGMNFHINIIKRDITEFIKEIKEKDYTIFGSNVNEGTDIKTIGNLSKYAIIMGNEGSGVSKEISELCDDNLYINMNSECESLNVGVATSIILYELNSR